MSDIAKRLFESLATAAKSIGPQVGAEMSRLATQGGMELASALFNGHGFVPYGPGQYTPSVDQQREPHQQETVRESPGIER